MQKTRQILISEHKLKNYLFYAIGEITLVVVGILIALSIDNWNNGRKDLANEQRILIQLKGEYQSNLRQLEEKIATRNLMIKASFKVLADIENQRSVNRDSLMARLVLLVNDPTFDPIVNDLISSGNIRLIRNEELKSLLTNWSSDIVALQEVEKRWTKLVDELVVPFYIEIGIARDALDVLFASDNAAPFALDQLQYKLNRLGQSRKSPATSEILSHRDLEGVVSVSIGLNNSSNIQSYALRNRIQRILNLISQDITL